MTGARAKRGRVVRRLKVDLGDRSYPIEIGIGTLAGAGQAIQQCAPSSRAFVITVPPVSRRYGGILDRSLRDAGYRVRRIAVPDGEATKNPRQLAKLEVGDVSSSEKSDSVSRIARCAIASASNISSRLVSALSNALSSSLSLTRSVKTSPVSGLSAATRSRLASAQRSSTSRASSPRSPSNNTSARTSAPSAESG